MSRLRDRLRPRGAADAGMTLVEMIVYSALLVIVLAIGGSLLVNAIGAQRRIGNLANATNDQTIGFTDVERTVRNASALRISHGGRLLLAATWVGDSADDRADPGSWRCVGYALRTLGGETTLTKWQGTTGGVGAGGTADVAATTDLNASTKGWNTVVDRVVAAPPVFTSLATATPGPTPVTTAVGVGVPVRISLEAEPNPGQQTVALETTVTRRPGGGKPGPTCWS